MALISNRYATAIFDLATEKGQMPEYQQEAEELIKILQDEQDFMTLLNHPSVLLEEKLELVRNIFEGKASDDFVGLMYLCVKKGRQNFIIDILKAFVEMAKEQQGFITATVTSSIPLDEEQLAQIKTNLENSTNKKIEITAIVDDTLLGGMIIRVGDKVIDGSIQGQLQSLKTDLLNLRLA